MYKQIGVLLTAAALTAGCATTPSDREDRLTANIEKQIGAGLASFNELDGDGSGYLNKDEARGREGLTEHWRDWDKNQDGVINRAEFSKFEEEDLEARAKAVERAADRAEDRIDRAN